MFKWPHSASHYPAVWEKLSNIREEKYATQVKEPRSDACVCLFSPRHKETTVTDSVKWKLKLAAWRMRILWNIFLCTVALQIYAPKRKLSGSKEDHSLQPSVRLVHSASASNISDTHKHSSIHMRHKWWSRDIIHRYVPAALCHLASSMLLGSITMSNAFFIWCLIFLLIFFHDTLWSMFCHWDSSIECL